MSPAEIGTCDCTDLREWPAAAACGDRVMQSQPAAGGAALEEIAVRAVNDLANGAVGIGAGGVGSGRKMRQQEDDSNARDQTSNRAPPDPGSPMAAERGLRLFRFRCRAL